MSANKIKVARFANSDENYKVYWLCKTEKKASSETIVHIHNKFKTSGDAKPMPQVCDLSDGRMDNFG